jgi:Kef-type K+ transport system membrane component KefB
MPDLKLLFLQMMAIVAMARLMAAASRFVRRPADYKMMNTRAGTFAISCATVDDVTAWCLLALITVIERPEASQIPLVLRFATLVLYVAATLFVIRPALRR